MPEGETDRDEALVKELRRERRWKAFEDPLTDALGNFPFVGALILIPITLIQELMSMIRGEPEVTTLDLNSRKTVSDGKEQRK